MGTAKGKKEIEDAADKARKAKVDATNKNKAEKEAKNEAALAKVPLSDEEMAFIARIKPMMSEGRAIMQPSPAEIQRYARLIKRKEVK